MGVMSPLPGRARRCSLSAAPHHLGSVADRTGCRRPAGLESTEGQLPDDDALVRVRASAFEQDREVAVWQRDEVRVITHERRNGDRRGVTLRDSDETDPARTAGIPQPACRHSSRSACGMYVRPAARRCTPTLWSAKAPQRYWSSARGVLVPGPLGIRDAVPLDQPVVERRRGSSAHCMAGRAWR